MRTEDLSPELLELARQAGLDVANLNAELSDADLEAVVGGGSKPATPAQGLLSLIFGGGSSGGGSSGGGGFMVGGK